MDRQNSFTKVFIFAKIFAKKTCVCVVVDNDDDDYAMQHGVHIVIDYFDIRQIILLSKKTIKVTQS